MWTSTASDFISIRSIWKKPHDVPVELFSFGTKIDMWTFTRDAKTPVPAARTTEACAVFKNLFKKSIDRDSGMRISVNHVRTASVVPIPSDNFSAPRVCHSDLWLRGVLELFTGLCHFDGFTDTL